MTWCCITGSRMTIKLLGIYIFLFILNNRLCHWHQPFVNFPLRYIRIDIFQVKRQSVNSSQKNGMHEAQYNSFEEIELSLVYFGWFVHYLKRQRKTICQRAQSQVEQKCSKCMHTIIHTQFPFNLITFIMMLITIIMLDNCELWFFF